MAAAHERSLRRQNRRRAKELRRARCDSCGQRNRMQDGDWSLAELYKREDPSGPSTFFCPQHAPPSGEGTEWEALWDGF